MEQDQLSRKLAVILHADVVASTSLVQKNETLAHKRMQATFHNFSETIKSYGGIAREIRGDALVAEFDRASDAVSAALAFQNLNGEFNSTLDDDIQPQVRIGISLGEVIIADNTITGAGVVLAQRLEQLADAGGVVVQGSVSETVPDRLPFDFQGLGEQDLKGFNQPVRAFVTSLKANEEIPEPEEGLSREIVGTSQFSEKPSVAVLPFTNMSGDTEQEYFSDGITEEITIALSKVQSFFVVSRNSAFAFKGRYIDIKSVSRQLGVRYLLQGSVRKARDRLRITAELIDGSSDHHVWANRYEGNLDDIFELQDQVVENVVGAIEPKLRSSEIERSRRKSTSNLNAYDLFLQALPHAHSMTREGNEEALRLTAKAIVLDDYYASAMALAAWCYSLRISHGWVQLREEEKSEALRLARRAIEIDRAVPETLWLAGYVLGFYGTTREEGIDHIDHALRINPNSAQALVFSGWLRVYSGDAETAKAHFEKANRLSPLDLSAYRTFAGLAFACFFLGEFDEAISWSSKALHQNPTFTPTHRILAASLGHVGRIEEARTIVEQLQALVPGLTISRYKKETRVYHPVYFEILIDGLRKAGLPE